MIISKARLKRNPGAQSALAKMLLGSASCDRGHGLVWSLFSETGEERRRSSDGTEPPLFLFREIEPGSYLIVSQRAPVDHHRLWDIAPKEYTPELTAGQRLGFVLRANPVIAVKTPGVKRSLRVDAIMHAKFTAGRGARADVPVDKVALDWLYKREDALGVQFDREHCAAAGYRQVRLPHRSAEVPGDRRSDREGSAVRRGRQRETISFSEIDFQGLLSVTDPERLTRALMAGVGKSKAYGCGLLLVRLA